MPLKAPPPSPVIEQICSGDMCVQQLVDPIARPLLPLEARTNTAAFCAGVMFVAHLQQPHVKSGLVAMVFAKDAVLTCRQDGTFKIEDAKS